MGGSQSSNGGATVEEEVETESREVESLWSKENSRALAEMREQDKAARQRARAENEMSAARRADTCVKIESFVGFELRGVAK